MAEPAVKVAWISYYPVEWIPEAPESIRKLPRLHPATWQKVLLEELVREQAKMARAGTESSDLKPQAPAAQPVSFDPRTSSLDLHVISVRRHFERPLSFEWNGVTFHCLKLPPGMRTMSLFWWETVLISRCLKRIEPDLVHAWGTERGAALVASRLKYPYLVTMQGLLEWYSQRVTLSRYQRLEARLEPVSLRRASVVTTESTFAVNWLRERYPQLEVRQAEHASNWLFHRLERKPQTRPLRFLFVGLMAPIKGADLLFKGLDRLCGEVDFQLTVVGLAPQEFLQEMKAATSAKLWGRVALKQNLTQEEVAEEMARTTMVLFPTRVDTSPNSVKESVVAGVPVVASAIGGITDYVFPGRNGFTFPAGDLEEFVRAVRAAIAHPLFGQGKVEPTALAQVREYLSPRVMRERFLAAYARVLELSRKEG